MVDEEFDFIPNPDLNKIFVPDYMAYRQTLLPSKGMYAIITEIAWRSTADNKQYAYFTSKVFLSAGEQTKVVFEPVNHVIEKKANSRNRWLHGFWDGLTS